jgi:hypothetical protein
VEKSTQNERNEISAIDIKVNGCNRPNGNRASENGIMALKDDNKVGIDTQSYLIFRFCPYPSYSTNHVAFGNRSLVGLFKVVTISHPLNNDYWLFGFL